ncbi:MAG TPA: peptidase S8, partial [Armatimonadota bacterium]
MPDIIRLPLKVVPAFDTDFVRPEGGGGEPKVFVEVTNDYRNELEHQIIEVRDHFLASFAEFPGVPAVAKVKVRNDAIAKSHRPTRIFSTGTCPIIGAEGLGQLLVSVTPVGIEKLARVVKRDHTIKGIANISTLESIEAYTPEVTFSDDTRFDERT